MIRVPRDKLDAAVGAAMDCAKNSTDSQGHKIIFPINEKQIEYLICGALSIIAPHGGPVTPSDVYYLTGQGTDFQSFPKKVAK